MAPYRAGPFALRGRHQTLYGYANAAGVARFRAVIGREVVTRLLTNAAGVADDVKVNALTSYGPAL